MILLINLMSTDKELSDIFHAAIKDINKTLPQYKIIRYFVLTEEDLVKTTKLTIKRPIEYEKIRSELEKAGLDMRKASGKFLDRLGR